MKQQSHLNQVRLLPFSMPAPILDGIVIGLFLLGTVIGQLVTTAPMPARWFEFFAAAAVVLLRRRFPLAALVIGLEVMATMMIIDDPGVILLALLIALYHVATISPWRTTVFATIICVIASIVMILFAYPNQELEQDDREGGFLAAVAWPGFAAATGAAVRASRENLAAAQQRADHAEATRELEASHRVSDERLRIARDVHDVVAHHLAVINVQSGVAEHMLHSDTEIAESAIGEVRGAAATALGELGTLLSALRAPNEDSERFPTPNLDSLDELIASYAAAGLDVEHRITGHPRDLPMSTQVAAFRITQEALTNAHKHGTGLATVVQEFDENSFALRVENPIGSPGVGSGYGLVGMRERAEAIGGTFETAELTRGPQRWFVVTAEFSARPASAALPTDKADS